MVQIEVIIVKHQTILENIKILDEDFTIFIRILKVEFTKNRKAL